MKFALNFLDYLTFFMHLQRHSTKSRVHTYTFLSLVLTYIVLGTPVQKIGKI